MREKYSSLDFLLEVFHEKIPVIYIDITKRSTAIFTDKDVPVLQGTRPKDMSHPALQLREPMWLTSSQWNVRSDACQLPAWLVRTSHLLSVIFLRHSPAWRMWGWYPQQSKLRIVQPQDEGRLGPWAPIWTRVTSPIMNAYFTLLIGRALTPFKIRLLAIEIDAQSQLMVTSLTGQLKHRIFTQFVNARVAFFHLQRSRGILDKTW